MIWFWLIFTTILNANQKELVSSWNYEFVLVFHPHSNILDVYLLIILLRLVENTIQSSIEGFFDYSPVISHQSCIVNSFFLGDALSIISHSNSLVVENNVALDTWDLKHFFKIPIGIEFFFLNCHLLFKFLKRRRYISFLDNKYLFQRKTFF